MPKFYFTYGTDGQPFVGGWTEVDAPDGHAACAAFRAYHPDKTEGLLNCSSVYDEAHFKLTEMYRKDNFGFRCHELIQITRTGVPRCKAWSSPPRTTSLFGTLRPRSIKAWGRLSAATSSLFIRRAFSPHTA